MDNESTHAAPTTTPAGTLTVTLWPDAPLGEHQRYAYRITDATTGQTVEGRDLFTGAGMPVDPAPALREMAGYLSAAGESRQYALDHSDHEPEREGLFPDWLAEAARHNADALTLLDQDPPAAQQVTPDRPVPAWRWISVVFLQGEQADEALEVIEWDGTDAAIGHVAGYDYGEETVQAALENGYVYDTVPTGATDRVATRDVYTLTYNHSFGYVGLLREFDALPDPALLGIDTLLPVRPAPMAPRRTPSEEGHNWFAPPPGATPPPGRGPSL